MKYETGGGLNLQKEVQVGDDLNDGLLHHVAVAIVQDGSMILLDSGNCSGELPCYGETSLTPQQGQPNFFSYLYVGGVETVGMAETFQLENTDSLVCTVSGLRVNHQQVEYSPSNIRGLELGSGRVAVCEPSPCENKGVCQDLWVSYNCVCPYQYAGERCQVLAVAHLSTESVVSVNTTNETGFPSVLFEFSTTSDMGVVMTAELVSDTYRKHRNFHGHNISWVKFLWGLIFVGKSSPP